MVIRLTTGAQIAGALRYNEHKVIQHQARVLEATGFANNELAAKNRRYTTSVLEHQSKKNLNVKKPTLHFSLSLHPSEQVSDEKFMAISHQFMQEMGYKNQPYIVYRHHDTAHPHVHIVTTCVDETGAKLNDAFIKRRINAVRQKLEFQFSLIQAQGRGKTNSVQQEMKNDLSITPGTLEKKDQLEAILRQTFKQESFSSIDEYKAVLKTQRIRVVLHQSTVAGKSMRGISYQLTDAAGKPVTPRVKASEIGDWVSWNSVEKQCGQSRGEQLPEESRENSQKGVLPFDQYKALTTLLSQQLREYKSHQGIYYDSALVENFPTTAMHSWLGKLVGDTLTEQETREVIRRFEEYKRSQLPDIVRKEETVFKRTMETYSQVAADINGSALNKLQFFSALSVDVREDGMISSPTNRHLTYQIGPEIWALVQTNTGPDITIPKTYSRGERTTMLSSASGKSFRESYYDVRLEHLASVLPPNLMNLVHRQLTVNYVARLTENAPIIGMELMRYCYQRGIIVDADEQNMNCKIRYKDALAQAAMEPGQLFRNQILNINLDKWRQGQATEAGRYMVALAQDIDRESSRVSKKGSQAPDQTEHGGKPSELSLLRERIYKRDPALTGLSDQELLTVLETRSQQGKGWIQQTEQDRRIEPNRYLNETVLQAPLLDLRVSDVLGFEQTGKYKNVGKGIEKRNKGREL